MEGILYHTNHNSVEVIDPKGFFFHILPVC